MLEILFYETKEGDYLVHFVNPNAKLGNRFHEQEKYLKIQKISLYILDFLNMKIYLIK